MTAVFDKHGLHFHYPENWEVQESYAPDAALEIYLVAPSGAFWSMLAWPIGTDPDSLMQGVLDSLQEQYEGFESHPADEELAGNTLTGFDSHFFCLDLLVTNRMRTFRAGEYQLLVMSQAESREFEQQQLVFAAITTSLLRGLAGPA